MLRGPIVRCGFFYYNTIQMEILRKGKMGVRNLNRPKISTDEINKTNIPARRDTRPDRSKCDAMVCKGRYFYPK